MSSTNLRTQMVEYYGLDEDDGLTMNLGGNPLLQFGLEETWEALCQNILNDLSVVNYVSFDSDTIGIPAFDLGDVLTFSGRQADGARFTCITSFHCKIGGKMNLDAYSARVLFVKIFPKQGSFCHKKISKRRFFMSE